MKDRLNIRRFLIVVLIIVLSAFSLYGCGANNLAGYIQAYSQLKTNVLDDGGNFLAVTSYGVAHAKLKTGEVTNIGNYFSDKYVIKNVEQYKDKSILFGYGSKQADFHLEFFKEGDFYNGSNDNIKPEKALVAQGALTQYDFYDDNMYLMFSPNNKENSFIFDTKIIDVSNHNNVGSKSSAKNRLWIIRINMSNLSDIGVVEVRGNIKGICFANGKLYMASLINGLFDKIIFAKIDCTTGKIDKTHDEKVTDATNYLSVNIVYDSNRLVATYYLDYKKNQIIFDTDLNKIEENVDVKNAANSYGRLPIYSYEDPKYNGSEYDVVDVFKFGGTNFAFSNRIMSVIDYNGNIIDTFLLNLNEPKEHRLLFKNLDGTWFIRYVNDGELLAPPPNAVNNLYLTFQKQPISYGKKVYFSQTFTQVLNIEGAQNEKA